MDTVLVLKEQLDVLFAEALGEPRVPYRLFTDHEGLIEALQSLDAETASRPVTADDPTSSIAAHCEHLRFSARAWGAWLEGSREPVDWSTSWNVSSVGEEEWRTLVEDLRISFERTLDTVRAVNEGTPETIGGMVGLVAHTAYHIGTIREKLRALARG
ncbi:MAG: hypothetical protein EA403_00785 [Spirochaetaceae bacterium]|nr:MAG: hypothetical protein EA403_00785 [Spirochaetaceae bacterium]